MAQKQIIMGCFTFVKVMMVVFNLLIFKAEIILRAWAVPGLLENYGKDQDQVFTDLWNSTMTTLQCCGFTNYTDFCFLLP
ncbi:tetraspanin-1-like [Myxocyprinus asiaticus]|uniref:tetraspanin-1-like n=1 Tax=Myxocyprinus asiaticus TaxID=70543 RepID=UPI002223BC77|nr:tetraspanin-1-like [Myxocyprinus asiaticus]